MSLLTCEVPLRLLEPKLGEGFGGACKTGGVVRDSRCGVTTVMSALEVKAFTSGSSGFDDGEDSRKSSRFVFGDVFWPFGVLFKC